MFRRRIARVVEAPFFLGRTFFLEEEAAKRKRREVGVSRRTRGGGEVVLGRRIIRSRFR